MKYLVVMALWLFCMPVGAEKERNLLVEVRIEGHSSTQDQGVGIGIHNGGIGVSAGQRTVQRSAGNLQRILVMDGGTASLSSIQTQPLRLRQTVFSPYGKRVAESYVYRSLGGGVQVTPRSRGNRVVIEVSAEDARPVPNQPMADHTLRLSTQVSGNLGEWIMIGDDERSSTQQGGRVGLEGGGQDSGSSSGSQRVWLRVTPQQAQP